MIRQFRSPQRVSRRSAAAVALLAVAGLLAALPLIWFNTVVHAQAPAATSTDDAAALYAKAAKIARDNDDKDVMSPSSSNLEYDGYPPYPPAWTKRETEDYAANAELRELAHRARSIDHADWNAQQWSSKTQKPDTGPDLRYLNDLRNLTNELADAAVFQHLQGDDAAAVETLRDILHLADLVDAPPHKYLVSLLVRVGIRAVVFDRLNVIFASAEPTNDPADTKHLHPAEVRKLIAIALDQPDNEAEVNDIDRAEAAAGNPFKPSEIEHHTRIVHRVNAEADMSAVAMACHLYKFATGHWPQSTDDLHADLPKIPVDPFGDGKQTIGYVLVRGGLPDGSDRPLVYSRLGGAGGLFYRVDEPAYSYYVYHDSQHRPIKDTQGGQFRDVAAWAPVVKRAVPPTTKPI